MIFGRFILNHVPMLDKDSVLNAQNICCNPVHGQAEVRKSTVDDYKISFGYDRSWLVLERWRKALDEIEQAFTTWRDMGAVLNVVRRPELLSCCVVALVEQSVEGFQNKELYFVDSIFSPATFIFATWPSPIFPPCNFSLALAGRKVPRASTHRRPEYSLP